MSDPQALTRAQLGDIFKSVLIEHRTKLGLLADLERARPTADRSVRLSEELAQGTAFTLLAEQGVDARLTPAHQGALIERGHDTGFIIKVIEHLEALRGEDGIKLSRRRLAGHVEKAGAEASALNMVRAQPVYLRALGEALLTAEQRYGDLPEPELDYAALIDEAMSRNSAAAGNADAGSVSEPVVPPPETPRAGETEPGATIEIASVARALEKKRGQDNEWDEKTCRQARFIFNLFARFMRETRGIVAFNAVTQADLARFDAFLRSLHANFGKSTKDPQRSIKEISALAAIEVPKNGALQGPTRNRHLAFLNQLIAYGRSGLGLALDPALTTTPFRARKDRRGRDQRPVPQKAGIESFFRRPLFSGYAGWDDIDTPGGEFYHRAEYFCSLLGIYQGARREEYCGLHVDDVIADNGPLPYIHIAPNEIRRIKNVQSVRNLALHPELIRLGFLDYVEAIRALGYTRVFPDLYSPSTKSPMGDRLYDQLLPSLRACGFRPHQVRHFFGDELKQRAVSKEFRADLLGHGGDGETTERYCNPVAIEGQMEHLLKLPVVTAHLEARPIRLLPWIVAREVAPWSRAAARGRRDLGRTK